MTLSERQLEDNIENRRLLNGFVWGIVATLAMTLVMLIGIITHIIPINEPIPLALLDKIFGQWLSYPLMIIVTILAHLLYGGIWGSVVAGFSRMVTLKNGILFGGFLWLIMQLAALPFLGWGYFGLKISPLVPLITLFQHLIYGVMLGFFMDRHE